MRILLLTDNFHPVIGGAETYVYNLAKGLATQGEEVMVYTNRPSHRVPERELHKAGFSILRDDSYLHQLSREGATWENLAFGRLDFLKDNLDLRDFDVIHANNHSSAVIAAVCSLETGLPAVATFHEVGREDQILGVGRSRLVYETLPLKRVIVVSRFYGDVAARFGAASRTVHIPFGVDIDLLRPDGSDRRRASPRVIGCLARFKERKGIRELIAAAALLRDRFPDLQFRIAGSPSSASTEYEVQLRELIENQGLAQTVTLEKTVTVEDIPRFMSEIDLLVQPSSREGLGVVLLEAMAAGVPIVANDCDGFRELVTHGQNAFVTSTNAPSNIAEAIETVVSDHRLRSALTKHGSEYVTERHNLAAMVEPTYHLYREVIQDAS